MNNILEYSEVFTKALDLQIKQKSTSGWMENNSKHIKSLGGRKINMPNLTMTGLGDYDREIGKYPKGTLTTNYQTVELKMDRGAEFYFDRHDVDESGYVVEAGNIMNKFQSQYVIPEIDAYRYSTLANYAVSLNAVNQYTPSKDDILSTLLSDLRSIQDNTGCDFKDLVISMPYTVFEFLELSGELNRSILPTTIKQGGLELEINSINGAPIIPVPSKRMKTSYEFDKNSSGDGFEITEDSMDINWIITHIDAPIAIAKTDNIKIFTPDENQDGDGWKTQYRIYHDIFIPDYAQDLILVNLG